MGHKRSVSVEIDSEQAERSVSGAMHLQHEPLSRSDGILGEELPELSIRNAFLASWR